MARRDVFAAVLLGTLCLGCTSIQWRDDNGRDHHLGLVAARVTEHASGEQTLERFALGADLRLSGSHPGYTLGASLTEETAPQLETVGLKESIGERFMEVLSTLSTEEPVTSWRFLWWSEDIGERSAFAESMTIGAGIRTGYANPGLALGYRHTENVVGRVFDESAACLRTTPDQAGRPPHTVLFVFDDS